MIVKMLVKYSIGGDEYDYMESFEKEWSDILPKQLAPWNTKRIILHELFSRRENISNVECKNIEIIC